ncbi:hypothetical protein ACWGI1_32040 [Streptomyces sp. NPDC054835]
MDSSVDEGEIRWTETSKYDSQRAHAITEWNKLREINIAPDAVNTVWPTRRERSRGT